MIRNRMESIPPLRFIPSQLKPRWRTRGSCLAFLLVLYLVPSLASDSVEQDWTHYVRIGAYGLKGGDAATIVTNSQRDGVLALRWTMTSRGDTKAFLIRPTN